MRRRNLDDVNVLAVVVPALNEAATIAAVIESCAPLGAVVIVVDDGSIDDTAHVARQSGADVLRLPYNLGVGAAVRVGLLRARSLGATEVLVMDADGQHDAAHASLLLEPVRAGRCDLAVGSRFAAGYRVGPARRFIMVRFARLASRRLGTTITDATSGFRAFGAKALEVLPERYPTEYLSDTVETLLIAAELGLRVEEVPVVMHVRQGGRPSNGAVASAYHLGRMVTVLLASLLGLSGRRAP